MSSFLFDKSELIAANKVISRGLKPVRPVQPATTGSGSKNQSYLLVRNGTVGDLRRTSARGGLAAISTGGTGPDVTSGVTSHHGEVPQRRLLSDRRLNVKPGNTSLILCDVTSETRRDRLV